MPAATFETAVDDEVAWLNADNAVTLALGNVTTPGLVVAYGRKGRAKVKQASLTRERVIEARISNGQKVLRHWFLLRLRWPLQVAGGDVDDVQRVVDAAINTIVTRIRGPMLDKTHGGRFLQVAEGDNGDIEIRYPDAATAAEQGDTLTVEIRYVADSYEITA